MVGGLRRYRSYAVIAIVDTERRRAPFPVAVGVATLSALVAGRDMGSGGPECCCSAHACWLDGLARYSIPCRANCHVRTYLYSCTRVSMNSGM